MPSPGIRVTRSVGVLVMAGTLTEPGSARPRLPPSSRVGPRPYPACGRSAGTPRPAPRRPPGTAPAGSRCSSSSVSSACGSTGSSRTGTPASWAASRIFSATRLRPLATTLGRVAAVVAQRGGAHARSAHARASILPAGGRGGGSGRRPGAHRGGAGRPVASRERRRPARPARPSRRAPAPGGATTPAGRRRRHRSRTSIAPSGGQCSTNAASPAPPARAASPPSSGVAPRPRPRGRRAATAARRSASASAARSSRRRPDSASWPAASRESAAAVAARAGRDPRHQLGLGRPGPPSAAAPGRPATLGRQPRRQLSARPGRSSPCRRVRAPPARARPARSPAPAASCRASPPEGRDQPLRSDCSDAHLNSGPGRRLPGRTAVCRSALSTERRYPPWNVASTSQPPGCSPSRSRQDQIANDLANASTPGYKADRSAQASFGDAAAAQPPAPAAGRPARRWAPDRRDPHRPHARAPLQQTGEPLDVALDGRRLLRRPDAAAGIALHAQRPARRSTRRAASSTADRRPVLGIDGKPITVGDADDLVDRPRRHHHRAASAVGTPRRRLADERRQAGRHPLHRHPRRRGRPARRSSRAPSRDRASSRHARWST